MLAHINQILDMISPFARLTIHSECRPSTSRYITMTQKQIAPAAPLVDVIATIGSPTSFAPDQKFHFWTQP